ncbi:MULTISPECIES: hypothetical protein [Bifidobacterium]|uniref:hypothetical protein n=1 Tax=Bifidobacterium TaxID=1678 RepID=UPI001BDC1410|nr:MULTISPECIES: hypothetical protein [Bifidobacterium]MBT1161158.1 hypothetical protein [Bifidobacterium sp. SO1]MBW3078246.1 hypothetical protein [Bifidobacterium simiiventris]
MATATLYAPEVDGLMRIRNSNSPDLILPIDLRAQTLIALLHNIVPTDGIRALWVTAERGSIEAFGTYAQLHADGLFDSYEQFDAHWRECYPDKMQWYRLTYEERDDTRLLTVNDRFSVRFVREAPQGVNAAFAMQLMSWLIAGVEECVRRCVQGTYNAWVSEQLPFDMRMGVMPRKTYWEIFPESLAYVQATVRENELKRFDRLFVRPSSQSAVRTDTRQRLTELSLNDYYRACGDAYMASRFPVPSNTASPEDWHRAYANPCGQVADMLDRDSPEEFLSWIEDERDDRHMWEMLPGPGFSWVTLMPIHDEFGWTLVLDGAAYPICANAIGVALALHDAGWPLSVPHADAMLRAVRGEDRVGIVPRYTMPPYDDGAFPDSEVRDFVTLPADHAEEVIERADWYPIARVRLVDQSAHEAVDAPGPPAGMHLEAGTRMQVLGPRTVINHGRKDIGR